MDFGRKFKMLWSWLTHWGRVKHICISKLTIIASGNGLWPGRRQAIIWTNAGILLIGPLGTNFNEILIEIHIISFKKIHLKMTSGKQWLSCLGLNVLRPICWALLSHNAQCLWEQYVQSLGLMASGLDFLFACALVHCDNKPLQNWS